MSASPGERGQRTKLVRGRWVVSDPDRIPGPGVLEHAAVAVEGARVVAVGAYEKLRAGYPQAAELGSERELVIPGLVNAHHHGQGLTTTAFGVPDDYLEPWIADFFARVRPGGVYLDTLYAASRLIRSGVTSVLHMGYIRDAPSYAVEAREALRAYESAGLRVSYGLQARDRNSFVYAEDEEFIDSLPDALAGRVRAVYRESPGPTTGEYFTLLGELHGEYRNHPRIRMIVCASGPQWCSDGLLRRLGALADDYGTGLHLHCVESLFQREFGRRLYGVDTIEHLDGLGLLGPHVSLGHAVWITAREMEICARTGTSICHNPSSNLRLRVGILPAAELLEHGVTVALGIDGTGLSDDDDMLEEIRLAATLHGLPRGLEPRRGASAFDAFRMATTGAARATVLDPLLGTLVEGAPADLVVLELERIAGPYLSRGVDIVETLVRRARACDVRSVLVDGELLLSEGRLTRIDEAALHRELAERVAAPPEPRVGRRMEVAAAIQPYVAAFYRGWDEPDLTPFYRPNSAA